jgi:putative membrane protein
MNEYGWHDMMGFGGGLFMVVFWILVILLIVVLVRALSNRGSEPTARSGDQALNLLKERYARGEIDREQYLKMKADLEK